MNIFSWLASFRTTIILIAIALVVGIALYAVSIGMDERKQELAEVQEEIGTTQDKVSVLEADWAYLTRPDRIWYLGVTLLDLAPLTPDQIISEEELYDLWNVYEAGEADEADIHPVAGEY
ncbi:MAG: hypothetical protein MJE68_16385 [Proteobacteria bacterium]|nr:hypothetical protein [Pseudomonadota bacterium]